MRAKRDEGLARRYELFGEKYSSENARRLEEDEMVKAEEAELTDQTDTDDEGDVESEMDVEERAVLESQRQVQLKDAHFNRCFHLCGGVG